MRPPCSSRSKVLPRSAGTDELYRYRLTPAHFVAIEYRPTWTMKTDGSPPVLPIRSKSTPRRRRSCARSNAVRLRPTELATTCVAASSATSRREWAQPSESSCDAERCTMGDQGVRERYARHARRRCKPEPRIRPQQGSDCQAEVEKPAEPRIERNRSQQEEGSRPPRHWSKTHGDGTWQHLEVERPFLQTWADSEPGAKRPASFKRKPTSMGRSSASGMCRQLAVDDLLRMLDILRGGMEVGADITVGEAPEEAVDA